jgi:hypothetical protein
MGVWEKNGKKNILSQRNAVTESWKNFHTEKIDNFIIC